MVPVLFSPLLFTLARFLFFFSSSSPLYPLFHLLPSHRSSPLPFCPSCSLPLLSSTYFLLLLFTFHPLLILLLAIHYLYIYICQHRQLLQHIGRNSIVCIKNRHINKSVLSLFSNSKMLAWRCGAQHCGAQCCVAQHCV